MPWDRIVGIDPGLRHTAVVSVTERGFSWKLLRTRGPKPGRIKIPHEAVFRDQQDAAAMANQLRLELDDGTVRLVASELATHAEGDRAGACMFMIRGVLAAIEGQFRYPPARCRIVHVLPDEVKKACAVSRWQRPKLPRLLTEEDRASIRAAKTQRAKGIKLEVEGHVLAHFPELFAVEADVGSVLKNHIFDAIGILIAAVRKEGNVEMFQTVGSKMGARLAAAHAPVDRDPF
jgi:hypothetical protein